MDEDEEDEEEDYEDEEGLGPPGSAGLGPAALFAHKTQLPQAFRGADSGPRVMGSQERPGAGPAHSGGATHVVPQLQPPDHGDWTYEEQFKQVGHGTCAIMGTGEAGAHLAVTWVLATGPMAGFYLLLTTANWVLGTPGVGWLLNALIWGTQAKKEKCGALDVCTRRTSRETEQGDGFRVGGVVQAKTAVASMARCAGVAR